MGLRQAELPGNAGAAAAAIGVRRARLRRGLRAMLQVELRRLGVLDASHIERLHAAHDVRSLEQEVARWEVTFPTAGILQPDREVDRTRARIRRVVRAAFRLCDHLELGIGRTGSYPDCDVVAEGAAVDVAYLDGGKRPSRAEPHQLRARGELGELGAARGLGALRGA